MKEEICNLCKGYKKVKVYYYHNDEKSEIRCPLCSEKNPHEMTVECWQCEERGVLDWIEVVQKGNKESCAYISDQNKNMHIIILEIATIGEETSVPLERP